jgi:hypothetical protein
MIIRLLIVAQVPLAERILAEPNEPFPRTLLRVSMKHAEEIHSLENPQEDYKMS